MQDANNKLSATNNYGLICHLPSVLCHLPSDTRNLWSKAQPSRFGTDNYGETEL